jgi:hypothetical protein
MFEIFINRQKVETPAEEMTGVQILGLVGLGPDHDLFKLQGEGDPTGGQPVGLDQLVQLKNGDHFRAIPGNRNFGG